MKVIVIGGGPAGIISAIAASKKGDKVVILERNKALGRKLLITGKGRCNITSALDINEFIQNVPGNGRFLYSAFQSFTNIDIINLLKEIGVEVKEERGSRIFPVSDKAEDVLNAFIKEIKKCNIEVMTGVRVKKILVKENMAIGVETESKNKILADKVILETGVKSYSITGSTGDGYEMARELGHNIIKVQGSLVPLEAEHQICQNMQGLSLKNVKIILKDVSSNKNIYEDFGEMLFTHFGVSGPTILSSSAHLLRYRNIKELLKNNSIKLYIDIKPALTLEELDLRVRRDFEEFKNKEFKNSLDKLLPKKMIKEFITRTNIDELKKVNEITKQERKRIVELLKRFDISIKGFRPVEEAIITAGGIDTKQIDPKTMESKIIKGLFFAGEIIDVDAYTGGFNLQIAYSTGYVAGSN